ncbi:MAG: hypothetical protein LBD17_06295 [Endomicrobium sp.]|nr:hypothetical protein [Endomicrobium sp.]
MVFIDGIEDRRQEWKVENKLRDIVEIVLLETLVNAEDFVDYRSICESELQKYIKLEKGMP